MAHAIRPFAALRRPTPFFANAITTLAFPAPGFFHSRVPSPFPKGTNTASSLAMAGALSPRAPRAPCQCEFQKTGAAAEAAGPLASPRTREVVEHVMLFKMSPDLSLEQEQDLLDHLYTLQYHYRHILATTLGRIFSKASDGYTHGVIVRLPSKERLEEFLGHPVLSEVLEKYVQPFCAGKFSLSFVGQVDEDIEALFKRGDSFESGIEHLVFVRPKEGAPQEKTDAMLHALCQLPEKVPPIVQLTAGSVIGASGLADAGYSHALLVRLPSEEDLATYNKHPAHREVIRKHLLPIAERILSVDFSVDPVGQERPV